MKNRVLNMVVPALLALWILNVHPSTVFAQGTAFTYQGQLQNNGALASGTYNFQFTLYTNAIGGIPVAGPVTNSAVTVSNGLFTVTMDFGPGPWTGQTNWLQIGVESNGLSSFTPLSPRQQLTPVPYAITAENVSSGGLSAGTYGSAVTFNNAANQFNGSFTGNGGGLTNVNAATLGGLGVTNFWLTSGNTGTSPTNGNFLGTVDQQPVEIRVGGLRALRLEPDPRAVPEAANLIGGFTNNVIEQPNSGGDVIVGGGYDAGVNIIYSNSSGVFIGAGSGNRVGPNLDDAVIAGGYGNTISSDGLRSVIGGGDGNTNNDFDSFIGGGQNNFIQPPADHSFIGGGFGNMIQGSQNVIAGGSGNMNSQVYSAIGGGIGNVMGGDGSASVIGGGSENTVDEFDSFIGGGQQNVIQEYADHSVIGGGASNVVVGALTGPAVAAVISGGQGNLIQTNVYFSFIGGGLGNTIESNTLYAVIAGGDGNMAAGSGVFIGGGADNTNDASYGTIGGGFSNVVNSAYATIGGGTGNAINNNANYAVIPGGFGNFVNSGAQYSFCAGNQAQALAQGEFVWADSQFGTFAATTANSVNFRCGGGVRFNSGSSGQQVSWTPGMGSWNFTSDRNTKDRFETVDSESVLARISQLPILEWSYKGYPQRHIGAMAQDFHALFPLNGDDKSLNEADLHGVALAAIQGLNRKLDEQIAESKEKDTEITDLKQELNELKAQVQSLQERN